MNPRSLLLVAVALLISGAAASADDWPQWRGPNRDGLSKETGLLKQWPKQGPELLGVYKDAGLGFSCMSIVGDVLYTMGARNEDEYAIALDVKDPKNVKQIWAKKVGKIFAFDGNVWGDGPRATPTVDGDFVYVLGGWGDLVCFKRADGAEVWRKSFAKDFDGRIMEHIPPTQWGYCESPLVDGNKLICCPGGPKGWMVALDKTTGKKLWQTDKLTDAATDSSAVVATIHGVRQYINSTFKGNPDGGGIAGIEAETGKVLWYFPNKRYDVYAVCPTPIVKDDLVYVTAGYNAGCNLLKISKDAAGNFSAEDQYAVKAQRLMKNDHGGVVLVNGHIYGYGDGVGWLCQELAKGKEAWSDRDDANRLDGKGSLTYADGHLYILSDQGEACLIEATTKKWLEKGRFALPALSPTHMNRPTHNRAGVWTHPVVANGRLYLRDQELIYIYKIK